MPVRYYKNGPARALAAPLVNATDTSITVDNASGFPSQFPYTIILDPNLVTEEVCDVTAAVGNILTITRGVDSTTAIAHANGAVVWHGVSARDFTEVNAHQAASTSVHGVTGSVVGTGGTQTITGSKNFTGGITQNGSALLDLDTPGQTVNQQKIFGGSNPQIFNAGQTVAGAELHSGTESHSGTETHSGTAQFSNAVHQWVAAVDSVNSESSTSTSFLPGTNPTGVVFTCPPSGRVMVTISSYFGQTTNTNEAIVSFAIRAGGTIGSGAVSVAASGNRALVCGMAVNASAPARLQASRRVAVTGLTPGSVYNVRIEFATSPAGACAIFSREIIVEPCF